jgi:hypothetical protein
MTLQDSLVRDLGQEDAWEAGHSVAFRVPRLYWSQVTVTSTTVYEAISRIVAEVFGNPFHPVTLDSALRKPGIVSLAESAYAERTLPSGDLESSRLADLAAALEEGGCEEPAILDHLRGPGAHVRGCWALDLVLGKN